MNLWHLYCCNSDCDAHRSADIEQLAQMLRALGMLRREAKPPRDLVEELANQHLSEFHCQACGRPGLRRGDKAPDDGDDSWPEARACSGCSERIHPDRLEIFPQATRCAKCEQTAQDRPAEREFCPRCGDIMTARQGTRSGVTNYQLKCRGCGATG